MEHYLDNAATTKPCEESVQAAYEVMKYFYGNPSSTHTKGREAKNKLSEYRKNVSDALGAKPSEVYFTSCGTESDNWAIIKAAELNKRHGRHIISSMAEHDAVRAAIDILEKSGYEVSRLRPDSTGKITAETVKEALREDTILVSLMQVNNETGAVSDISEISKTVKAYKKEIIIHTDAVQGFMKVPFKAKSFGADLISISGHKVHALKGVGALYIKEGLRLKPFICGGHQESGRRAGTEALPQIASFAAACKLDPQTEKIAGLKKELIEKLRAGIPEIKYLETEAPHILNISMPGWKSEVIMNYLESAGVYVSKSSACRQGRRSHVLEAIGLDNKVIDGSIRIGLSRYNTSEDTDALADALAASRKLLHI